MSEPLSAGVESGAIDRRMADVVAEITDRLHAGEPVDAAAYVNRHPELADRLRPMLAALDMLAQFSSSAGSERRPGRSVAGEQLGGTLGDFRILREVGRGGMGVVYEAEQISLQRRVALKILPFAATMDPRQLQRFHNEARAAACLDHPHIVKVHAVGCERGVHYFAMKFIEGQSLAELIAVQKHDLASGGRKPPVGNEQGAYAPRSPCAATLPIATATTQASPRDAAHYRRIAQWGIQAAEALEHAHSLGIVHRDIKPANLMIDAQGTLWITDFGLARTATDAGLTMTGDVVGTLRYMSPEQALAKHGLVDHRTDLYALGATLYEMLTLRPAIDANDREESLRKIAFEEPPSPRSLDRAIPADLETVVLKALAKEPAGRYATAQELADDLRRYVEHKPIRARRPALVDRLAKWGRRHRPLVHAGAVFLVLAVGGLTAGIVRIAQEQAEAAKARDLLIAREQSLRQTVYVQDIVLAWQALREGERERMRGLLDRHIPEDGQEDLRSFEWFYLRLRSQGLLHETARVAAHEGGAYCVKSSPDGRTLASAGKDGVIRFWDARTLRPQGELRSGQGEVNEIAFAPDGKSLASAGDDGTIWVWDLASARKRAILRPEGRRGELSALAISPDGKVLASGGGDGRVWSWDIASGRLNADRNLEVGSIHYLTFAPDGRFLATANDGGRVLLLDPVTLWERGQFQHSHGSASCVSISHNGKTLAAGGSAWERIFLWDLATEVQRIGLPEHKSGSIESLSFSPDDTLLAAGGNDGRVKLWDIRSGGLRASLQGHTGRVWCTAIAPDGEWLTTAGEDGTVKLWHVLGDDNRRSIRIAARANKPVTVGWVAFSPDGQTLFTWSNHWELGRWSTFSGKRAEPAGRPLAWRAVLAPASRLVTVANNLRDLLVQDLSGATVQGYRHAQRILAIAISPDGERVAFADDSPTLWMWEVGPGQPRELAQLPSICRCLAFAPDGETIAVADAARVLLLEAVRGRSLAVLSGHAKEVGATVFSPNGRLLATSAEDSTIRIWELPSGQPRYCLWNPEEGGSTIAFSPDSKTLASGARGGEVILWNVAGGQELMRLDDYRGWISSLAFSPDGKILAVGWYGTDPKSAEVTLWYADGAREAERLR